MDGADGILEPAIGRRDEYGPTSLDFNRSKIEECCEGWVRKSAIQKRLKKIQATHRRHEIRRYDADMRKQWGLFSRPAKAR